MLKTIVRIALAGAALVVLSAGQAHANEDAIKYRKATMKALGGHMAAATAAAAAKAGQPAHLPKHLAAIADIAAMTKDLFPEGSDFGETEALAKIWQDKAGFAKEVQAFEAAAADVMKAGGDAAKAGAALANLGKTCKSCHETFREKKKN